MSRAGVALVALTLAIAGCKGCEEETEPNEAAECYLERQRCLALDAAAELRARVPPPDPPPAFECPITSVPDGLTKEDLEAWLRMMAPWAKDQASFEVLCAQLEAGIAEAIEHSAEGIPPPDTTAQWVWVKVRSKHRVTVGGASGIPVEQVEQAFPCGPGVQRRGVATTTLCASPAPLPEGDYVLVAAVMGDTLRFDDAEHHHQIAFGFDANGVAGDNYAASPQYPNDFWDGLDTVFVLDDAPSSPPVLSVLDLSTAPFSSLASAARVAYDDDTLVAMVPAGELASACPGHRFTSFVHRGDYGLQPPNWWAGDTEPVVHTPLEPICDEP